MRILTLFLALFLTLLPESFPVFNSSQVQDICWEDTDDIEEEAVIRTFRVEQCQVKESSESVPQGIYVCRIDIVEHHPVIFCHERQWLAYCRLRL